MLCRRKWTIWHLYSISIGRFFRHDSALTKRCFLVILLGIQAKKPNSEQEVTSLGQKFSTIPILRSLEELLVQMLSMIRRMRDGKNSREYNLSQHYSTNVRHLSCQLRCKVPGTAIGAVSLIDEPIGICIKVQQANAFPYEVISSQCDRV